MALRGMCFFLAGGLFSEKRKLREAISLAGGSVTLTPSRSRTTHVVASGASPSLPSGVEGKPVVDAAWVLQRAAGGAAEAEFLEGLSADLFEDAAATPGAEGPVGALGVAAPAVPSRVELATDTRDERQPSAQREGPALPVETGSSAQHCPVAPRKLRVDSVAVPDALGLCVEEVPARKALSYCPTPIEEEPPQPTLDQVGCSRPPPLKPLGWSSRVVRRRCSTVG
jgi:hypothetical protein